MTEHQIERLVCAVERLCDLVSEVVALNHDLLETALDQQEDESVTGFLDGTGADD